MSCAMVIAFALQTAEADAARVNAPKTQPPIFAQAYLDEAGRISDRTNFPIRLGFIVPQPYHVFEKRGRYTVRTVWPTTVKATRHVYPGRDCILESATGKKIELEASVKAFAKQQAVVLLAKEEKLDPFYAKILEGRVIVVRTPDRFVRGLPAPTTKKKQK